MNVKCHTKHESRRSLYCSSSSHQKSVSADDKSKHNKLSPSSPESTSRLWHCTWVTAAAALAIAASQSPLYMMCVFYNFPRREEAKSLLFVLQPPKKVYFCWWQIKTQQAQPFITINNLLTLALYMSHSGSSFGYRCIAVTALHAVCVFLRVFYNFPWERSGTTDLSRRPKSFVKAAIWKSWAKILPRGNISGHLKILGRFLGKIFTHKKWNGILLGKSWIRSRFLYKILFP